jgi:hypothetical protein
MNRALGIFGAKMLFVRSLVPRDDRQDQVDHRRINNHSRAWRHGILGSHAGLAVPGAFW